MDLDRATPEKKTPQTTPDKNGSSSPLLSDASFTSTPLITSTPPSNSNPTFITNSLNLQRNPSTTKEQTEALNRAVSISSNRSIDPSRKSTLPSRLVASHQERGRARTDSDSSLLDNTNNSSLTKSPSNASVRSVQAVGSFPLGSLRVVSPSPPRAGDAGSHECLKSGDVFIVRGVPEGAIIGYDTHVLTVSMRDQFEGIKGIPPGVHLVWGGSAVTSLRNGFWFMSPKRASDEYGEIHVRRWDNQNEVLQEEISMAEVRIQKSELPELLPKMQSYAASNKAPLTQVNTTDSNNPTIAAKDPAIWLQLTSCMKGPMLNKVTGQKWNHWQVSSFHDYSSRSRNANSNREADITIDNYKDEVLNFIFPKDTRTFSETSQGRARTEQALDSTSHIEDIINENCTYQDSDEIIGELQFCYLTGMLLGNLACMEHWAHVVKTVFHAHTLAVEMPVFFTKFIQAVHTQFRYDNDYIDGSILDHDTNLVHDLTMILITFKSRLNERLIARGSTLTRDQTALATAFEEFEEWLWKWGWDLRGNYVRSGKIQLEDGEWVDAEMQDFEAEDERGEWAPVVVDLEENGREKGLIKF